MFLNKIFARHGIIRRPPGSADDQTDGILHFSFDRVVAGILYHLIDERLAAAVDGDSLNDTLARLASDRAGRVIARWIWESLTNRGRLEWLLDCARTTVVIDQSGVATFRPLRIGSPHVVLKRPAGPSGQR